MCKQIHDFILSRLRKLLCKSGRDWRRTFPRFHAFSLDVFVPSRSDRKQNGRDQWFLVPSGLVLARKWYAPTDWRESRFQIFRCVAFSVNSTRNIFAFAVILKDYSNFSVKVNCNKSLRIVSKQCTLGKDG